MRDYIATHAAASLALGGFLIGLVFGAVIFRTGFCAMGALSDIVAFADYRRFRAWVLAGAVAIIGAQWLAWGGVVDLSRSMYLAPSLNWFGNLTGGALFGFGMVLAGGCASRNLARLGGGDLRAGVTLVFVGLAAYVAMSGLLGPARLAIEQATALALPTPTQSLADLAGAVLKPRGRAASVGVTALVVGVLLAFCFHEPKFRASPLHIASGVGVGLCIVAGWALTGLAFDELSSKPLVPASLAFVRPTGDTLDWIQRFTALGAPGFGVSSVLGTVAGAFAAARATGRFRLTTFVDTGDTLRHLGGAALMGIGGIMALGCTIGQGVTGLSTLAAGAFLTFAGLAAGGIAGVKTLQAMLMREG